MHLHTKTLLHMEGFLYAGTWQGLSLICRPSGCTLVLRLCLGFDSKNFSTYSFRKFSTVLLSCFLILVRARQVDPSAPNLLCQQCEEPRRALTSSTWLGTSALSSNFSTAYRFMSDKAHMSSWPIPSLQPHARVPNHNVTMALSAALSSQELVQKCVFASYLKDQQFLA